MTIKMFSEELRRFLASREPEVLCITGRWGIGKTYAWNYHLQEAQGANAVALPKYSYVSLFGLNSLTDLRTAIVENTVDSRVRGQKPDLTSFTSILSQLKGRTGKFAQFLNYLPTPDRYLGSANRLLFLIAKEQIVCIDDIERAGAQLDTRNILGLVSSLKEEKSFKVVLLLNDEALEGIAKKEFRSQLEKVADTTITFKATPGEAAEIGLDKGTAFHDWLNENLKTLSIVNIRLIKRIERLCRRVGEILASYDLRILKQAIHTTTLAAYSKFQPDDAPSLTMIKNNNLMSDLGRRQKDAEDDPDDSHRTLLAKYAFHADDFDIVIIDGVELGFFDKSALLHQANLLEKSLHRQDKNSAYGRAWDLFHGSFSDNQEEVLDEMEKSVRENYDVVSLSNLDATVSFLKEFGRTEQALDLLKFYIGNRDEGASFWNSNDIVLRGRIGDPDVKSAIAAKFAGIAQPRSTEDILRGISERNGWGDGDIEHLALVPEAEFVHLFKSLRDDSLRGVIAGALFFRNISNANENMRTVSHRVDAALRMIGAESQLNAKRVRNFGVEPDAPA